MGIQIEVNNINNVVNYIKNDINNKVKDVNNDIYKYAIDILEEAKRLCPKDTGNLANSGLIVKKGNGYSVEFTADYALYVHEDMSVKHTNGQAKFLTQAVINVKRARGL